MRGEFSSRDIFARSLCGFFLAVGVGVLMLTVLYLLLESGPLPGIFSRALGCFIGQWRPLATPPQYGFAHAWAATIIVTGVALVISFPVGTGIGVFIAELAPPFIRRILGPALELLAGIPAVVYGFFGAVTLVPLMQRIFDLPTGETLLGAGIVLSIMMLPFIASTSGEAFRAAYRDYRESALSLGVDQWYLFRKVIIVRALPGLIAALALGFARGVGETLAVLMMAGNTAAFPTSLISRGQPLTALLATEIGETPVHSEKYRMLFTGAFLLMAVVLALNYSIAFLKGKLNRGGAA